jgi:hypothetical protein
MRNTVWDRGLLKQSLVTAGRKHILLLQHTPQAELDPSREHCAGHRTSEESAIEAGLSSSVLALINRVEQDSQMFNPTSNVAT